MIDSVPIQAICPNLKGEHDKIIRQEKCIQLIKSKDKLPNENFRNFIFDASKAKPISDVDYILNPASEAWKDYENHLLFHQLNDSQKQSIVKAINGEELVLIQGPPETGKSTAIAEMIWQQIRLIQKQCILLTSEANLAVDNAINRLKNNTNNLVKPVRFGSEDKIEEEGMFYSFAEFKRWKEGESDGRENAISNWMNRIRQESKQYEEKYPALSAWTNYQENPDKELRSLFYKQYIDHINVVGATGSSIGVKNSEDRDTRFYSYYKEIFTIRKKNHPSTSMS